jgi:N utilization substance protein A
LDLGNAEAVMPSSERIPYERLERGARIKALILEVRGDKTEEEEEDEDDDRRRRSHGGPQIVVSRSHPDFIRRLFELEVPELVEGVIEIRAIARDAGHRTKIAVASSDPNVDPVGACVGARGSRVRQVVNELRGEKVDIVEWRENIEQFIAEALSPAKVRQVILDTETSEAIVVVPDHQLSLAIGKEGQNARLAARLSGYRVDIRSETEHAGVPSEDEAAEEAPATAAGDDASVDAATEAPTAESDDVEEESTVAAAPATEEAPTEEAATEEAATEEAPTEKAPTEGADSEAGEADGETGDGTADDEPEA